MDGSRHLPGPVVLSRDEIRERVEALGASITAHYRDRWSADDANALGREDAVERSPLLLVLGVLKGSFVFLADLVRTLEVPIEIDFIKVSSYGSGTESSGEVSVEHEPRLTLRNRDVLVVEDIVDSGTTLNRLLLLLEDRGARSVEVCSLLVKGVKAVEPELRWVGFDVPDEFLVGYGLDYDESFRHLADIASLQKEPPLDGL